MPPKPRGVVVKPPVEAPPPPRVTLASRLAGFLERLWPRWQERLAGWGLGALVWLTALAVWVPLRPRMPSEAHATAWQLLANEGVARGLVFGRDLVMTVGPYAAVFSHLYSPATDLLALAGGLLLAAATALVVLALAEGMAASAVVVLCLVVTGLAAGRDALLLATPLLVALLGHRLALPPDEPHHLPLERRHLVALIFGAGALGLLPLIKLWTLPLVVLTLPWLAYQLTFARLGRLALPVVSVPPLVTLLAWVVAGQPLMAISGYLESAFRVIRGYSVNMASHGPFSELLVYVGLASLLLVLARRTVPGSVEARGFLTLVYGLTLFVGFKAGFVRHDEHSLIAAALLLVVATTLPLIGARGLFAPALALLLGWTFIEARHTPTTTRTLLAGWSRHYGGLTDALGERLRPGKTLVTAYDAALDALREAQPAEVEDRTRDAYPAALHRVLGARGAWRSRPVPLSPGLYDSGFGGQNASHVWSTDLRRTKVGGEERLTGAPEFIRFAMAPIHGHLPTAEFGPSLPALMRQYVVREANEDTLWLRRRAAVQAPYDHAPLFDAYCAFAETVEIPDTGGPVVAIFRLMPTSLGSFLQWAYKPASLELKLDLDDGPPLVYRVTPAQSEAGFILSPLVEDAGEVAALFDWEVAPQPMRNVRSFSLNQASSVLLTWEYEYRCKLFRLKPFGNQATGALPRNDSRVRSGAG